MWPTPFAVQLADKKGLAGAKHVYLTGGAVWAATTILHPEKVNDALVPLTVADLDRLLKMLADKPDSYPVADLTPITDMNARMAAEAEMLTVRKVFSRQNLVAGVTLLKAAIEALKLNDRKPSVCPQWPSRLGSGLRCRCRSDGIPAHEG